MDLSNDSGPRDRIQRDGLCLSTALFESFGKGAGVVELAALEMLCTGNRTVGSNPTLSASYFRYAFIRSQAPHNVCFVNPARPGTEQR